MSKSVVIIYITKYIGDSEILNARFSMAKSVGIIYAYVCGDFNLFRHKHNTV